MEVNGVLTPAELLDAKTARKIYETSSARLEIRLFEYVGQRLFKVRIFPIEPRKEKEIRLKYTQLLPRDGNLVRYTCPLSTRKFSKRLSRTSRSRSRSNQAKNSNSAQSTPLLTIQK